MCMRVVRVCVCVCGAALPARGDKQSTPGGTARRACKHWQR
jgi:hypothetical protein